MEVDPRLPNVTPGIHHPRDNDPTGSFVHGEEERSGQPRVNLQRPKGLEEDPGTPKDTPGSYVPGNYQAKVGDYTGKGKFNNGTMLLQNLLFYFLLLKFN